MRTFLPAILLAGISLLTAKPAFQFNETIHDFGSIREDDGPVKCVFEYTNSGDEPLIITDIKTSCGCTTTEWISTPVQPGGKGTITAVFDPKDRPGDINKHVYITSNVDDKSRIGLGLKGTVIESLDRYEYQIGPLLVRAMNIDFDRLAPNEPQTLLLRFHNTGDKDYSFSYENVPACITITSKPMDVKPGVIGNFIVTMKPAQDAPMGFSSGTFDINLIADGKVVETGTLGYMVEIVSQPVRDKRSDLDPSSMSNIAGSGSQKNEKMKGAHLSVVNERIDLGRVMLGQTVQGSIIIRNTGQDILQFLDIIVSDNRVQLQSADKTLNPGEEGKIRLEFLVRPGMMPEYWVELKTNDPVRPDIRVMISGQLVSDDSKKVPEKK
jgi:hypothetical protein